MEHPLAISILRGPEKSLASLIFRPRASFSMGGLQGIGIGNLQVLNVQKNHPEIHQCGRV